MTNSMVSQDLHKEKASASIQYHIDSDNPQNQKQDED